MPPPPPPPLDVAHVEAPLEPKLSHRSAAPPPTPPEPEEEVHPPLPPLPDATPKSSAATLKKLSLHRSHHPRHTMQLSASSMNMHLSLPQRSASDDIGRPESARIVRSNTMASMLKSNHHQSDYPHAVGGRRGIGGSFRGPMTTSFSAAHVAPARSASSSTTMDASVILSIAIPCISATKKLRFSEELLVRGAIEQVVEQLRVATLMQRKEWKAKKRRLFGVVQEECHCILN